MITRIVILFAICSVPFVTHSWQGNDMYIDGAFVKIEPNAMVHVVGDFHLDNGNGGSGILDNDGLLEIRGNFNVESIAVEQTGEIGAMRGNSSGTVRLKNAGYAQESINRLSEQAIVSNNGADLTGNRAFYKLEVQNDNQSNAGVLDNIVYLDGGDVEVKQSLEFLTDCRIRTDIAGLAGTPPSGLNYAHALIISNPVNSAIVGYSTTDGDNKRYIEGRLDRQVTGTASYYFPVGLEPGYIGSDGMAAFNLHVTSAPNQQISSALALGETVLGIPNIYCDIGDYPDAQTSNQPWLACIGGPDGLSDFSHLSVDAPYEWSIENSGADFSYDLEVRPGPGLDAAIPTVGGSCGAVDFHLRFLAKDGFLMENGSYGTVINPPPPFNTTSNFPIGYAICPPENKTEAHKLYSLSEFSRFRLHGAPFNETVLPVELVELEANARENRYIEVRWATASEVNNAGFELNKSTDGITFSPIAWLPARSTSSGPAHYSFNDIEVTVKKKYYYRLRQIDHDGTYEWSPIVHASLTGSEINIISLYPNPVVQNEATLSVQAGSASAIRLLLVDELGQEVWQFEGQLSVGSHLVPIPVKHLSSGAYILQGTLGHTLISEKLIVYN